MRRNVVIDEKGEICLTPLVELLCVDRLPIALAQGKRASGRIVNPGYPAEVICQDEQIITHCMVIRMAAVGIETVYVFMTEDQS